MARERWFGATGVRVPEIAVEGDERVPLADALVVESVVEVEALVEAHRRGTPVVVRCATPRRSAGPGPARGRVRAGSGRPCRAARARPAPAHVWLDRSTYSICACDLERGEWGVAVQSKFLAVGSVVAWAEAGVGAIATQAYANPSFGPDGLALLREGQRREEVLEQLIDADEGARGPPARRRGRVRRRRSRSRAHAASSGRAGAPGRLRGAGEHPRLRGDGRRAGRDVRGDRGPARRAAARALAAGQAAGGDRRGQQSAALLVSRKEGGYAGMSDVAVDLRVDDHPTPIAELERLYGLHELYFGETPDEEWLPVDDDPARRADRAPGRAGLRRRPRHRVPSLDRARRTWRTA